MVPKLECAKSFLGGLTKSLCSRVLLPGIQIWEVWGGAEESAFLSTLANFYTGATGDQQAYYEKCCSVGFM